MWALASGEPSPPWLSRLGDLLKPKGEPFDDRDCMRGPGGLVGRSSLQLRERVDYPLGPGGLLVGSPIGGGELGLERFDLSGTVFKVRPQRRDMVL